MKKLNKILAMLLCAVMIVCVMPFGIFGDNFVSAAETKDSLETGYYQGENDAVIIYSNTASFGSFYGRFKNNQVDGNGVTYDRIIIVFTQSTGRGLATSDFYFGGKSGSPILYDSTNDIAENIVWTSKCTINYPANVWEVASDGSLTQYTGAKKLINCFDGRNNITLPYRTDNSVIHTFQSFNWEMDYITLRFAGYYFFFATRGFDLKIGENCVFSIKYPNYIKGYPCVVNATTLSSNIDQNVELLSGTYGYIALRSRVPNSTNTLSGKSDLKLGKILVKKNAVATDPNQTAFISFDSFKNFEMNVEIDGAIFDGPVYLIGGKQSSGETPAASTLDNVELNVHIKNGTFRQGIMPALDNYVEDSSQVITRYEITGKVDFNVIVDSVILGEDKDICGEMSDHADDINSALYYTCPFEPRLADKIRDFDSVWTLCEEDSVRTTCGTGPSKLVYKNIDDEQQKVEIERDCGHNYAPYVDVENWMPYYKCTYCLDDHDDFTVEDGCPVLFVSGDAGNLFNTGITEADGCNTVERASELLGEWLMGGTIVNCASLLKVGEEVWHYPNGWITFTSKNETCKVQFQGFVNFDAPVEFSGLHLAGTSSPKTFFLNYNSFIVNPDCTQEEPLSPGYKLAIVSGARAASPASIEKYATDYSGIDQFVELKGLNWDAVMAGTKQAADVDEYYASNVDKSVDCAGIVKIYISGDANVNNVDLVTIPGIHASVIFDEDKSFNINNNHDSSKIIFDGGVNNVIEVYGNFTETDGDIDGSEEHVYIHAPEAFEQKGLSLREKTADGIIGIRATYGIDSDIDESSVVEFGTLVVSDFYYSHTRYFRGSTYYGGNGTVDALHNGAYVAKSVAYLMNSQGKAAIANYELGANDTKATFRATVEFSDDDIKAYDGVGVTFTPYAVVKNDAGWFTVIGDIDGSSPLDLANTILSDDEASNADKEKAAAVIDYLAALAN